VGIKELRARIEALRGELRQLADSIGDGNPTDEQVEAWTTAETELGERQTELDAALTADTDEARQARKDAIKASRSKWKSVSDGTRRTEPFEGNARGATRRDAIERARAALDDDEFAGHVEPSQRTRIERMLKRHDRDVDGSKVARLMIATGTEAYRGAFCKIVAGRALELSNEERAALTEVAELRTHLGLTDGNGGYNVPTIVDPTVLLTGQGSSNAIVDLCRVETITNDVWRGVSSGGSSWGYKAEGAEFSAADPTFTQPTVTTRLAGGWITYSFELEGDWQGLAVQLTSILGEGYRELLAEKLTTGSATANEPVGVVTALAATTAGQAVKREVATAGAIVATDVYDTWAALAEKWRARSSAAFLSSTDVQNAIRQLGTVDPNFTVNIGEEGIARLFGRRYPMNDYMEDLPTGTGTQGLLIVGDWQQYLFAQRVGMTIERVEHVLGTTNNIPTGERGMLAWARNGADVLVPAAFKMLTNKSA
jgi:HK97 family phage major capsid protein